MKTRGDLISKKRKELGLTQTELALDAAVSRSVIANLELGRRGTPSYVLRKIARAIGEDFETLVDE